ncbi:hypothetical protein TKK_0011565 [Trichogramma kaykai]
MENYVEIMSQLMRESRDHRGLRRDINALDMQVVKDELLARNCSMIGVDHLLRERLLRARLRLKPSLADRVPWFESDEHVPDAEETLMPNELAEHSGKRNHVSGKHVQFPSSSSEDDTNQPTRVVIQAEIHNSAKRSEPSANASQGPSAIGRPVQPTLAPLGVSGGVPPQFSMNKEVLKMLRTHNYQFTVAERVHEHRFGPNATEISKKVDQTHTTSPIAPVKPPKTPQVKHRPENSRASRGWYPMMPTEDELNRIDHVEASTTNRADSVDNSRRSGVATNKRNGVATNKRAGQDTTTRGIRVETDAFAQYDIPLSTPFEPYWREPSRHRLPSAIRNRNPRLRRAINYSDTDISDIDENCGPARTSSRNSHKQPSIFEPNVKDRSSLQSGGQLATGKTSAVKLLKSWGLKFSEEDKQEDAEDFLDQLNKCVSGSGLAVVDVLSALSCIFSKRAARWHSTVADRVQTWWEFENEFRNQFIGDYDYWDLMTDLQRRTQARGERITAFLSCFRYIVSRFSEPPPKQELLIIAYRNLLPEYRHAMADKIIDTFEQLEKLGRSWERKKDIDSRYAPPVPAEKMRVPGGAYSSQSKIKLAAIEPSEIDSDSDYEAQLAALQLRKQQRHGKHDKERRTVQTQSMPAVQNRVSTAYVESPAVMPRADDFLPGDLPMHAPMQPTSVTNSLPIQPNVLYQSAPLDEQVHYKNAAAINTPRWPNYPAPWRQTTSNLQPPMNSRSSPNNNFIGACFICQSVGHRASACPEVMCNYCKQ